MTFLKKITGYLLNIARKLLNRRVRSKYIVDIILLVLNSLNVVLNSLNLVLVNGDLIVALTNKLVSILFPLFQLLEFLN